MKNCILIGVAGGSGSGKTTVANNLVKVFKSEVAVLLEQDAYYRELMQGCTDVSTYIYIRNID